MNPKEKIKLDKLDLEKLKKISLSLRKLFAMEDRFLASKDENKKNQKNE